VARRMIATFGIKAPSDQVPISTLSGGNVQRSVLANSTERLRSSWFRIPALGLT